MISKANELNEYNYNDNKANALNVNKAQSRFDVLSL